MRVCRSTRSGASTASAPRPIVYKEGKTREVFEAERNPNSGRNKAREAEYDRLKIERETHGLDK